MWEEIYALMEWIRSTVAWLVPSIIRGLITSLVAGARAVRDLVLKTVHDFIMPLLLAALDLLPSSWRTSMADAYSVMLPFFNAADSILPLHEGFLVLTGYFGFCIVLGIMSWLRGR